MPQVNPWHLLFAISPHVKCSVKNNWNAWMCWQVISTSYWLIKVTTQSFPIHSANKITMSKGDAMSANSTFHDMVSNLSSVTLNVLQTLEILFWLSFILIIMSPLLLIKGGRTLLFKNFSTKKICLRTEALAQGLSCHTNLCRILFQYLSPFHWGRRWNKPPWLNLRMVADSTILGDFKYMRLEYNDNDDESPFSPGTEGCWVSFRHKLLFSSLNRKTSNRVLEVQSRYFQTQRKNFYVVIKDQNLLSNSPWYPGNNRSWHFYLFTWLTDIQVP